MRKPGTMIVLLLCGALWTAAAPAATAAADGEGLVVKSDPAPWADLQGRVSFGTAPSAWRSGLGGQASGGLGTRRLGNLDNFSVMGDYYFAHPFASTGGLRATSGLIVGPRSQGLAVAQPNLAAGGLFSADNRGVSQPGIGRRRGDATGSDTAALPYIGLGYTARAARGALSVSADFGMLGPTFGGNSASARPFASSLRSLDDAGRDSRLLPVLQLGALVSF